MSDELKANTTISHYRIISKIGAGGMGEVYRAHDSRLDRDVAIKMLPDDFSKDADRLHRFEQEAKATSALNHPNILTVYDIGEHDGVPFIVSELLDGEELRDRLNEGPIPIRKTLDYAQQIVSGLSAAHERGITHRDLKPENLFITRNDRVKILDFGLAKLREIEPPKTGSEDATRRALTEPGVVMGTVGYMSPEQVRGAAADHRSDIFSFGVILYEMLVGRRAFGGDSMIETMHSILKEDVPELDENSGVRIPPALDKVMRRCLEKKPDHRFHSAHDLGFALDAVTTPTSATGSGFASAAQTAVAVSDRSDWLGRASWALAAVFLIAAAAFAYLYFQREELPKQTMRFSIVAPDKYSLNEAFALSPNGKEIAFTARDASGIASLWIRSINSVDARQLPSTEGAAFPFWSPDSRTVGFFAANKLKKIDAAGGPAQSIADTTIDPRGGTWTPDGTIVFAPNTLSPLMRVSASGGVVSELTKLDTGIGQASHRWPSMLPDGKHFLFFGRGGPVEKQGIYAASLDNPEPKLLVASPVTGSYAEANGAGYLLFAREGSLMAQRLDVGKLELSGEAIALVDQVLIFPGEIGPTAYSAFSAAAGTLIYRTGDRQSTRLVWHDRAGKSLEAISEPAQYHEPSLSKDARKVLFGRNESSGPQDLFIQDLTRGSTTRLTFDAGTDSTGVLSPDETQVAFYSDRSSAPGLYRKSSSGAGNDEMIWSDSSGVYPDSWSRDGKYLICDKNGGPQTKVDLWVLPINGEEPFAYLATPFEEAHAQFSPDGRWVAYTSNESGRAEVYIQSFPIGVGKWQVSTSGGDQPMWRDDGKELFYIAPDNSLTAVSVTGSAASIDIGRPQSLFQTFTPVGSIADDRNNYVPAQDGQRFLINTLATANSQPFVLVLNWAQELKK